MKFLAAAWYEFLKNIRDIKMVAIMIVFPVVTIYMLGTAVEGFFNKDVAPKLDVACVNEDAGMIGSQFDQFLGAEEISQRLNVRSYPGREEARKAVDDGTCAAMIYLPKRLSESVESGSKGQITVYGKDNIEFVKTLVGSFTAGYNTISAEVSTGGNVAHIEQGSFIQRENRTRNGAAPGLKDYYAILVLLQILVCGGIFGANITTKAAGSDMHIRVHALPVGRWTLLAGRILGSTVYLFLSSAFVIAFTELVYGVNWNGSVPVIAGTVFLFCMIMVGMGAVFGRVFSKFSTAVMMVLAMLFFLGVASGAVSPTSGVTALAFLTPNYYAKVLLFGSIYGYSTAIMVQSALILAGIAAAVFGALAALTRRVGNDNL